MTVRVGINGSGRVGRTIVRWSLERADIGVFAVNDVTNARALGHLLHFDSAYGRLNGVTKRVPAADAPLTGPTAVPVRDVAAAEGCDGDA
jgi:glyceraldehyde-3-phosphate dehydrogenase/erythrose-4-phosphate dehydrogenase